MKMQIATNLIVANTKTKNRFNVLCQLLSNELKTKLIMLDEKQKEAIEWNILMALFTSTNDQTLMLIGKPKQHAKLIFNKWKMQGDKLQKVIETESSEEHLQIYKDVIQNAVHELRKKLNK